MTPLSSAGKPLGHRRAWRDPSEYCWHTRGASADLARPPCQALACQRGITGLGATPCQALARQRGIAGLGTTHLSSAGTPFGVHRAWCNSPVERWPVRGASLGLVQASIERWPPERIARLGTTPMWSAGPPKFIARLGMTPPVERWRARGASPGLGQPPPCQALARQKGIARFGVTPLLSAGTPEGHRHVWRYPPVKLWHARGALTAYSPEK